jgi:lysosomal Pro-X carboxypeptidase
MAMGDYPYPSTYILNGLGTLPAWPVRVACEQLDFPPESASNATLLEGLREAVGVYYNYSQQLTCYDLNAGVNEESQNVECVGLD